jgi:hypothetical protein
MFARVYLQVIQSPTGKVAAHVQRIEAVEKDLKALSSSSAGKADISGVRAEMKKLYDGLHVGEHQCIFSHSLVTDQCFRTS